MDFPSRRGSVASRLLTLALLVWRAAASRASQQGPVGNHGLVAHDGFDLSRCPKNSGLACDPFPTPAHGSVRIAGTATGHVTLSYVCEPGMYIVGTAMMVCHADVRSKRGGVWRVSANDSSPAVSGAPVCAECPPDFDTSPLGSCYKLMKAAHRRYLTADQAQNRCQDLVVGAGHTALVAIETAEEQAFVAAYLEEKRMQAKSIRDLIIGLKDINVRGAFDFRWVRDLSRKPSFFNWEPGHPKAGHRATVMRGIEGQWASINGSFVYVDFLCERAAVTRCASPLALAHGKVTIGNASVRHRATFDCDFGFELSHGAGQYDCARRGLWVDRDGNSTLPTCKRIQCPAPKHYGTEGLVVRNHRGDRFPFETALEYSCKTGYRLAHLHPHKIQFSVRSNGYKYAKLTCGGNGKWSNAMYKCQKCACNTEYTTANVCDWSTGRCHCDQKKNADGETCSECADGFYRRGADVSARCVSCGCGEAAMQGNRCNKRTGNCTCYPGCFGRCTIKECNLYCPGEVHSDELQGSLYWNKTGVTAERVVDCPLGRSSVCNDTLDCQGVARRRCVIDAGEARWATANLTECRYADELTEKIAALQALNVTVDTVAMIAEELSEATRVKLEITAPDIALSTSLLEKVVSVPSPDKSVGVGLLDTVAAISNANLSVLEGQGAKNTTNRLLATVEHYATFTPLQSGELGRTFNVSGIEMQILMVDPREPSGSVDIAVTANSVSVPRDWFGGEDPNAGGVRLQVTRFADDRLFVRSGRAGGNGNGTGNGSSSGGDGVAASKLSVPSNILSVSTTLDVNGGAAGETGPQQQPINMTFKMDLSNYPDATGEQCVYWDLETSDWGTDGCRLVTSGERDANGMQEVTCACTHLTHFAILMDLEPTKTSSHTVVLQWITYIGVSLSLIGLLLTFVIMGCYPKLRRQQQMQLLLQLCLAWTGALVSFLIGGELASYPRACAAFAAFIHYFLLVVFMWTLVQAVFLYMALVRVYSDGAKVHFKKAVVVCWTAPAVIVLITLGATETKAYLPDPAGANVCMLNIVNAKAAFLGAYLVPICAILLTNSILFALVLRRIIKPRPGMNTRQLEDHKRDLKISISLAVLLGLTWLTGIGMVGEARIAMSYIFTILNAFLGFFIFLLHFALRHEVVEEVSRSVSTHRQSLSSTRTPSSRTYNDQASFVSAASNSWQPIKSVVTATAALKRKLSSDSESSADSGKAVSMMSADATATSSPEKPAAQNRHVLDRVPAVESADGESDDCAEQPGASEAASTQPSTLPTPSPSPADSPTASPSPADSPTASPSPADSPTASPPPPEESAGSDVPKAPSPEVDV